MDGWCGPVALGENPRMPRPFVSSLAAGFAALLLALCAGAVWSVVGVFFQTTAIFMVVPAIYVARHAVGVTRLRAPALRALIAALLVVATAAYALYLHAASAITSYVGVSFPEALATIGPKLAWMIAMARTSPAGHFVLAAAPLVAALVEYVEARRRSIAPP